jgi:hypothetical protein
MKEDTKGKKGYITIFVKAFRHWRTGKLIRAEDYGKEAFAFKVQTK